MPNNLVYQLLICMKERERERKIVGIGKYGKLKYNYHFYKQLSLRFTNRS